MSIKVLVADDSITIQKVIGIIFGGDEYSLTVVDNGKAAIDKAREINPDILLIDALMPGMNGYEVTEAVRSTPALAAKPILILTGTFEPFDEEKARKCGADDFIAKPFESQQIITKVKELLELGRSRVQSPQAESPLSTPEIFSEQTPEVSVPVYNVTTPVFDQEVEDAQPGAQADIWSAFTTEEVELPAEEKAAPIVADFSAATIEPDVFAIVTEENDAQLIQSSPVVDSTPSHTGSQWVPIEENTFEFEEDTITEPLQTAFTEQEITVQEPSFGDIAFEDEIAAPAAPVLSAVNEQEFADFVAPTTFAPLSAPATPFAPLADPTPAYTTPAEPTPVTPVTSADAAAPATVLSEDQLRAALSNVSREVIERIVWEVVPDLAEALIREAIRKIKEGV